MPDIINANGLQVKTLSEIVSDLETGLRAIYGNDINLDSNSPDGQLVNIIAQAAIDIRELAVSVNASFDPDEAIGTILDQRVVINNIERRGGTFTIQPIQLTLSQTLTLPGLDANFNSLDGTGFTVQDNAGNKFILIDTATLTAGVHTVNFRAQAIGLVETTVGTITNMVTVVLGVTNVINSVGALTVGQNQETDAQLRVRRQQSVAISSSGYLNGLLAKVLNLDGVSQARLYENVGDTVDANGIPAHGIWLIVEDGANSDIAEAIYEDKSYGCNMKGSVTENITTASGAIFVAKFDRPSAESLYISFQIKRTIAGTAFNDDAIKQSLIDGLSYTIGQYAETSSITAAAFNAIAVNGGGGVPIEVKVSSDGVTWVDFLNTATLDAQWALDKTRITITEV